MAICYQHGEAAPLGIDHHGEYLRMTAPMLARARTHMAEMEAEWLAELEPLLTAPCRHQAHPCASIPSCWDRRWMEWYLTPDAPTRLTPPLA